MGGEERDGERGTWARRTHEKAFEALNIEFIDEWKSCPQVKAIGLKLHVTVEITRVSTTPLQLADELIFNVRRGGYDRCNEGHVWLHLDGHAEDGDNRAHLAGSGVGDGIARNGSVRALYSFPVNVFAVVLRMPKGKLGEHEDGCRRGEMGTKVLRRES